MDKKLKPCPFCGGEAEINNIFNEYHISCIKCPAAMASIGMNKDKLIEAWNRRVKNK